MNGQLAATQIEQYPRRMLIFLHFSDLNCLLFSFQRMIDNLITKEMLENCEPPSEDQLQELDLVPLQPVEKGSAGAAAAVAAQSRQRRLRKAENGSDVSSDESLVSEIEPVANRWGFDDDGSPVFYRFTSIAFQHVGFALD